MGTKAAQRAALMAQLEALGDDDEDELEDAIDELGDRIEDALDEHHDDEGGSTTIVHEAPEIPDPADAVRAEAAIVKAHGAAEVAAIEARTQSEIDLMEAAQRIRHEDEDRAAERDGDVDPLAIVDEVLGGPELELVPDSEPQAMHRWFRKIERRRR